MIHIRCGDDILTKLRSLAAGPAVKWCDPLCQGPTPGVAGEAAWQDIRARFIADTCGFAVAGIKRALRREEAAIRAALNHDEIVLWCEADLFDQIILVWLLVWFADHGANDGRLSLVCIGDHPDIDRFVGLGQLSADHLGALLPQRETVTAAQIALARRTWDGWRAPDPAPLQVLADGDTGALPFLADAIRRHLAELPDATDGLALTERMVLDGIAAGHDSAAASFRRVFDTEKRPWLGDAMLWSVLDRMAQGPAPLIRLDGPPGWKRGRGGAKATRLILTPHGEAVLAGKSRHASLPRWVGGIRIR